jgi:GNAT superfamily N-acetyltransferase
MSYKKINNIIIRTAKKSDTIKISKLYKDVWDEYKNKFPNELLKARQPNSKIMENWIKNEKYYVADLDNQIIGIIGCFMEYGNCKIIHMAVLKDFRKLGLGYKLLKKAENFAIQNNAMKIWFDTSTRLKDSIKFYKSNNYKIIGELKKHYWGEDILLLEKLL